MTEPTDDELDALIDEVAGLDSSDEVFREFARAVLAKWGTPAPVGVEPMTARELADRVARGERWRIASTQQPAQPQAGAVPLTDEQIRAMCKEPWIFDTAKQWVRLIEHHHGIKGGQHGTE